MKKNASRLMGFLFLSTAMAVTAMPAYPISAASIKLNKTTISMKIGEKKTLKVTTKKAGKITWSTNKPNMISIQKQGKKVIITAKKSGNVKIICSVGGQKKVCKVKITKKETEAVSSTLAKIDQTKWNYNQEDNVYWQVGIPYCSNPASTEYETLGIYIPGDYMKGTKNEDGTYICEINSSAKIGDYTAKNAPMVLPVNTPGYSAMAAPSGYINSVTDYTKEGMIYISAGCRGRNEGAPAGVTDLKAAIRYIRYNAANLPGSSERIFSFGMSGGGAQSALLGSTGDNELYTPYLQAIGAVEGVSDAVAGSMCWCPITNLDYADEAYEWNMGMTRSELSEDMQELSNEMAKEFADYMNELGLKDEQGNSLSLEESKEGIYQAGSYYEYLKTVVEQSLNHFLEDTSFPYTIQNSGNMHNGGGFGRIPNNIDNMTNLPEKEHQKPENNNLDQEAIYAIDGIDRNHQSSGISLSGTYETVQDYIDALNSDNSWITYHKESNTVSITSITDFVKACKNASKDVGAFDDLNKTQGENTLFGYEDGMGAHFDSVLANLLKDNETYGASYAEDLAKKDALGNTVDYRVNMYNPMYYLTDYYRGYQTSTVAKYWRIRTGINQGDTALSTEVNLALALKNYGVNVDFETVWGQGHTQAERTGNSTENFIAWVMVCLKEE